MSQEPDSHVFDLTVFYDDALYKLGSLYAVSLRVVFVLTIAVSMANILQLTTF